MIVIDDDHARRMKRVMARQRLCRMRLRAQGKLALEGYTAPPGSCVTRIWRLYGWVPVNPA